MILRLLLQLHFLFQFTQVGAVTSNRTIDDTFGDSVTGSRPIFLPEGNWDDASCSPSHCTVLPPSGQAFRNNYHAATYLPGGGARTAQLSFKGTAIYVFFILANNIPNAGTETFADFILDESPSDSFHHAPTSSSDYQYNALVFSKTNLKNIDHKLLISADGYDTLSFVNFDYAIYTYDDGVAPVVTTMHSNPVTSPQEQPATPIVIMAPQTVTTIISGVPVVTQISATTTHFDVGSSSLGTSSSSPSATIPGDTAIGNTSGTAAAQASLVTSQASSASVASSNDAEAPKTPVGVIVGGAVGGIITVLILIFLFLFCRRRRRLDAEMSSTEPHPGTPWHPVLVPFTAGLENATRAIDSTTLLIPSRKEREIQEAMPQPESRNMYTPSNSIASNSAALRTHRQSLIIHRIVGLKEAFQATGSSSSGSSGRGGSDMTEILEQNQVMKAEIARLQAQLNFDRALGLTNEPLPGYSRHGDDHLLKQTQGSVAVT